MALAVTGYLRAAFSSHRIKRPTPTRMPMVMRTCGISHPWLMEYRRKNTAARSSATPAIQEKSFTPTRFSQSNFGIFHDGSSGAGGGVKGGVAGGASRGGGAGGGDASRGESSATGTGGASILGGGHGTADGFVAGCASAGDGIGGAGLTGIASCAGLGAVRSSFSLRSSPSSCCSRALKRFHAQMKDHNNSQEQYVT